MKARPVAAGRLSKLRTMSAAEILERVRYRMVITAERMQHSRNRLTHPDRLRKALRSDLQQAHWETLLLESCRSHPVLIFPSLRDRTSLRRLFDTRFEPQRAATLYEAARVRRHQFEFFGEQFQYGDRVDWHADPVSKRPWPVRFHADVPVHRGDTGAGDVKHVWELSRHQFLIDLGKAHFLTGDAENLDALRRLVRSWIAENPYATGVNWAGALEPAFRTLSWLWAYHLTRDALDPHFHLEWLGGFYDHGRFLARHMEHHSSPYNHLIGEAAALYMLGTAFPEFRESASWRTLGRSVLEKRLREQFYADGGSVEQSTFYHHATVGFYLLAALTARAVGEDLSARIWRAIERGLDFSMALVQPDGFIPEVGGADDGKPIRLEHLPLWDFRPYLAMGAVLFERGDFKWIAGRFHEDAVWLLGPAGLDRFDALRASRPAAAATALGASGYFVMRSDWSDRADYVVFDCGEQAAGMRPDAVPNSMHGHADCLSVIAWLGGRRVLVDSGLFAYNCGGAWEAHFRETAAHNTARVDSRDQALHIGKMAWSHSYRPAVEGWSPDGPWAWVLGSHDGYARGSNGITHRRAVSLRRNEYLLIYDEFSGDGEHDLELNFHFAPGTLVPEGAHGVRFDQDIAVEWTSAMTWDADIACGGDTPDAGWIAPSLGVRQPAPRLRLRTRSRGPLTSVLTIAAMCRADETPVTTATITTSRGDGRLIGIAGAAGTDWIAAAGISNGGAVETDARLAVCRLQHGQLAESVAIGGTFLRPDVALLAGLAHPRVSPREVAR